MSSVTSIQTLSQALSKNLIYSLLDYTMMPLAEENLEVKLLTHMYLNVVISMIELLGYTNRDC